MFSINDLRQKWRHLIEHLQSSLLFFNFLKSFLSKTFVKNNTKPKKEKKGNKKSWKTKTLFYNIKSNYFSVWCKWPQTASQRGKASLKWSLDRLLWILEVVCLISVPTASSKTPPFQPWRLFVAELWNRLRYYERFPKPFK